VAEPSIESADSGSNIVGNRCGGRAVDAVHGDGKAAGRRNERGRRPARPRQVLLDFVL
jgi:hypothetical protein